MHFHLNKQFSYKYVHRQKILDFRSYSSETEFFFLSTYSSITRSESLFLWAKFYNFFNFILHNLHLLYLPKQWSTQKSDLLHITCYSSIFSIYYSKYDMSVKGFHETLNLESDVNNNLNCFFKICFILNIFLYSIIYFYSRCTSLISIV